MMAATPQYLVRKHHPVRGCYERYLICSDHLLRTVDPASLTTTNTYPCAASLSAPHSLLKELTHAHTPSRRIRDVRLMDTPSDGGAVRLRVPSRFFCGLLEELELSVVNPEEHAPLLGSYSCNQPSLQLVSSDAHLLVHFETDDLFNYFTYFLQQIVFELLCLSCHFFSNCIIIFEILAKT